MSSHRRTRPRLYALLIALCFLPGIAFVASLTWLKQQPDDLVFLVSGITATVTIVASLLLSILHDHSMGEWERSNTRFSSHWGEAAGTSMVALLLSVPVFREWIVSVVANWAGAPDPDGKLIILAFVSGFMAMVIARMVCMVFLSIGWALWKSRSPREAA